jgi:hypothetical protein
LTNRRVRRTAAISLVVGVGYQSFATFAIEPMIARLTSGRLPDGSVFRPLVGNEQQLVYCRPRCSVRFTSIKACRAQSPTAAAVVRGVMAGGASRPHPLAAVD